MKNILLAVTILFATTAAAKIADHPPKHYLYDRIPKKNPRYPTLFRAIKLLKMRNAKTIVETGTSRNGNQNFEGDGGSTIIFSEWALDHDAQFYSVDLDPENLWNAKEAVEQQIGQKNANIHFVCSDSLEFLKNFTQKIDFLYLDSYDFEVNNPLPSQYHHLYEIQIAYPLLHEKSVVMIDDCDLPHGGKGKLAIAYLLERGWKIIEDHYQVILVQ